MKVFLTGATGFIGSFVTHLFCQNGWDVSALVLPDENTWRIKDIKKDIHLISGDIKEIDQYRREITGIKADICIHLAWFVQPGKYWQAFDNVEILSASLNFFRLVADAGCKRFIGMGTCAEYDLSLGYLSETSKLSPKSLYAASKLSFFYLMTELGKLTGMETAWMRLFYPYGPKEDGKRLVPSVINGLIRKEPVKTTLGIQKRDYIFIEDVAEAVFAISNSHLTGPVNIGSGEPVSIAEIVDQISLMMGGKDLIRAGEIPTPEDEPPIIYADNLKLRSIGWEPRYNIGEGLRKTINWWQDNASL